jgi:RNA polymerase sigma-70 factor (ECF subfamily)
MLKQDRRHAMNEQVDRSAENRQDRPDRIDGGESAPAVRQPELPVRRLLEQQPEFLGFLRRRLGSEAVAEDLLQQSLVRAVERHHSLKNDESVVPWFYRILRHAVIDYYRAHDAETRRDDAYLRELVQVGEDQEPSVDDLKPSVCACLSRLLPTLRPNYAELIRRIDLEGEVPQRIAEELKISLNNLTVRLHRARQALRESLEATCGVCTTHGCLHCTCE